MNTKTHNATSNERTMDYNVTITKSLDNEYRVPSPDGYEDGAYYTDDKEDACDTAQLIYGRDWARTRGATITCTFRTVVDHPTAPNKEST